VTTPAVYHGQFGSGLFQIVYRRNDYSIWTYFTLFEWHFLAVCVLSLSVLLPPLALVSAGMWTLTAIGALRPLFKLHMPCRTPLWCWLVVFVMHVAQPIVRGWHRRRHHYRASRIPPLRANAAAIRSCSKVINTSDHDLYWRSDRGRGREHLLGALVAQARSLDWHGDYTAEWQLHDVELYGGLSHFIQLRTATEELGEGKRFTRVRCSVKLSGLATIVLLYLATASLLSLFHPHLWPLVAVAGVDGRCRLALLRAMARPKGGFSIVV
jgi:hypothetical protein